MKAVTAKRVAALNVGTIVEVCDNSGAKLAKIVAVKRAKTVRRRQVAAAVADMVKVSIKKGLPDMLGEVFDAIVVRQKKPYRRANGERICFWQNAVVLIKDEKGTPKGTMIKGPIAREVVERWPSVAKIASMVV